MHGERHGPPYTPAVRDAELIELGDSSFAESLREKARWCPSGEAWDGAGVACVASATRLPVGPFNAMIGTGESPDLDAARQWFAARRRGFTVYLRTRDEALLARCRAEGGLVHMGDMPGMVIERPPAEPSGVELVVDDFASFVEVSCAAWESVGMRPDAFRKHFAEPQRLRAPHVQVVLARVDGRPAATAMALLSHGIGGIYWVGTRPEARQRGLGEAVTAAATRWAFEQGARAVVLQASVQGEPVYRKMGFREITRYPWFVTPIKSQ
jgi:ribosomal protein S18 acetylase RimI-like enzyme